jgi:D-lactate dehydrogenase (cytochrome)
MSRPPILPASQGFEAIRDRFPDLLRDESNLTGEGVERVYLPETAEEVAAVVGEAARLGIPISVSGARTGITGGAVPVGTRWIVSLQRLNRFLGADRDPGTGTPFVRAEAGLSLAELAERVGELGPMEGREWVYPVDPTEWSASVGGTVATNASGSRSYHFGPTGAWVRALRIVLADGRLVELRRGEAPVVEGEVRWPEGFGDRVLRVPDLPIPSAKCVAGYGLEPGGDLLDLFIGAEGTLGVVVEAELQLAPLPHHILSLFCFLPRGADGLELVQRLKDDPALRPLAIEFLDASCLDLLREERASGRGDAIPDFPATAGEAIYLELPFEDDSEMERGIGALEESLASVGASLEDTWAGDEEGERARMRHLRHAVPEAVNARITRRKREVPGLHKVGTDLAVPDGSAAELYRIYRERRSTGGVESVLFGHAAENHLHLNFLPRSPEELARAKAIHLELAREAVRLGGSVTAEHGIGRIKRELVEIQYGPAGVEELRRVKDFLDPQGILNPGVLLPDRPGRSDRPGPSGPSRHSHRPGPSYPPEN